MTDPVASPREASPAARRTVWPFILLAVVALGGAAFWFGDVPNRYHAAQEMRAGRVALLASDLPKALGYFRAAALLRPTDEAIVQQYDQTQTRWVEMVEQKLAKLDATAAYLALRDIPPTESLLVEPHLGKFRTRIADIEQGARGVADGLLAKVQERASAGEFDEAYATLGSVEPLRGVAPGLTAARQRVEEAQVGAAMGVAQTALQEEQFDDARAALKPVAELAAKNKEYAQLGVTINETEVRAALRDARKELADGKLKEATAQAERAAKVGVLADEVTAARGEIRDAARARVSGALALAISQHDKEKVEAALADGEAFAEWKKVSADDLLQPVNVTAFVETLKAFDLGADKQGKYLGRLDIPLVVWAAPNFQDQAGVKEFLRDSYTEWSRALAKGGLPACALYIDELAGELGAERDGAWRQEAVEQVAEKVHVAVAVRNPEPDSEAPPKLNADATATLRGALAKRLGTWPKLVEFDEKKPVTVTFYGYYAGFRVEDYPNTTEKSVRYQSGTTQVPNRERQELVADHNELLERKKNVMQQLNDKLDYINSVENNPNASDWDRSQLVYKRIEVASDRNLIARWNDELADYRNRGDAMPKFLSEPVYAMESYEYIEHHYECEAGWGVTAILHGNQHVDVTVHTARTNFDTDEVAGNADHNVPVRAPKPVPEEKLKATLARELTAKAANVDELVKMLPALTLQSFVNFYAARKSPGFESAEGYLGLSYAWERMDRALEDKVKTAIIAHARQQLNLPVAEAGQ